MSDTKIFSFPDGGMGGGGSNGILAMLPALMQQRGLDPNILALANGRNGNNGGWGDGLFAILLLFILMGRGGFWGNQGGGGFMGNGQGGVVPMLNNDANTAVIMQAVQRNGFDIASLATALNTSSDAVMAAINALGGQICNLGNQMGQNTNQIVTAVMQGNNSIISQLCSCCCDLKQLISQFGAENRLAICEQTNTLQGAINFVNSSVERGFASTNFETQRQTCDILGALDKQTQAMIAQFAAIKEREDQREIQNLRDQVQAYQLSASQQQQTANIVNQIRPCPVPAYITCNPFGCNGGINDGYPYGYPYGGGCNNSCGC